MRVWPHNPSTDDAGSTTRRAYELTVAEFGPGAAGPYLLVADNTRIQQSQLDDLHSALSRHNEISQVDPLVRSHDGAITTWSIEPRYTPTDEHTGPLIEKLRATLPDGVVMTGYVVTQHELSTIVSKRVWVVAGVVIAMSMISLMFMFRSVLIPLKAAVLNLLSIAAAYGASTVIFQTDIGAAIVGLDHGGPISSFVPLMMFAILFGLSMDYEVFLISRIWQYWLESRNARTSITRGVAATGPVITAAATIMVAVFVGFAFEDTVMVKMFGVGMAIAILVDATLIRLVLLPAIMTLLGPSAWWAPTWLTRRSTGRDR